jgi:prolipoprotein diacylglyceryltransferase
LQTPVICFHIWNWNDDIATIGDLAFRWNTLMLLVAFLAARQLLLYLYASDKSAGSVANMPVYLVVMALIGAHLGQVLFYEPATFSSNPMTVVFPFAFKPEFHLLRQADFSLHGAVLAALAFLFLYHRKEGGHQRYAQVLDRVALASCLAGTFIFLGSFLNSDIVGKETDSSLGTVFIQPVVKGLMKVPCCIMRAPDGKNPLDAVTVSSDRSASPSQQTSRRPIVLELAFQAGPSEQLVKEFLVGDVKKYLYEMAAFVYEPGTQPLRYSIIAGTSGRYSARISTLGVARYPVQLLEALACLLLFLSFYRAYKKKQPTLTPGKTVGFIGMLFWTLEFGLGFLKEDQSRTSMLLNIFFAVAAAAVLTVSYRSKIRTVAAKKTTTAGRV